ncbi:MAG: succinylglutamate desuccinylase/aspartoacylase family protein [Deltaproteobacteria bacterium]|jgi:hypothetical protein|nr:succinylglutamate desuccinylase/aspartoacylase family protein [Deltaproteobacteria bacterium]
MKRLFAAVFLFFFASLLPSAQAAGSGQRGDTFFPDFTLHKLESGSGPTLLVVGGIQGDEPGGFSAASLLATHYTIKKGNVWVVPNLNFLSIIRSSRGVYGDMNRKFAYISPQDPQFEAVRNIQNIILDPKVDLVLNLHDGSGFYRPKWENDRFNPKRWGQCIVIDQERVDDEVAQNPRFQDLQGMAGRVLDRVNVRLLRYAHVYHIKNTTTRNFDLEMEKTLSYFAVCAGKAAFGLETSKELPAESRVYYHSCLLEAFMREMGIEFERKFHLSPAGVALALNKDISIRLYNKRTVLKLDNARVTTRGFIPVRQGPDLAPEPSNPLLTVLTGDGQWRVIYGNRTLTRFTPEYMPFDESVQTVNLLVDDRAFSVNIGDMVRVNSHFMVRDENSLRVNAIGAKKEVNGSEADVRLERADFAPSFSLDQGGNVFRVEFYREKAFCGMILVNFGPENADSGNLPKTLLTAGHADDKNGLGR